jgi:hypothetical protein
LEGKKQIKISQRKALMCGRVASLANAEKVVASTGAKKFVGNAQVDD